MEEKCGEIMFSKILGLHTNVKQKHFQGIRILYEKLLNFKMFFYEAFPMRRNNRGRMRGIHRGMKNILSCIIIFMNFGDLKMNRRGRS